MAGLFWLLALALFVAPFLRARDDIGSYDNDFTRDTVADSETDKLDIPFADDVAKTNLAAILQAIFPDKA